MANNILVVEDDFALRTALNASLEVSGFNVVVSENAESALVELSKSSLPDMVITDIQMGEMSGIELLKHIRKTNSNLPVLLMTAYGDVSNAVSAMKLGACDYLQKPFEPEILTSLIDKYLPKEIEQNIIVDDPASIEIYQYARRIGATVSNVLLSGPSGSGKEVMARFIHENSKRKDERFIAINCAAIPENMLEATLFGYEKGAFTGAHQSSAGKFEQAQAGTLLLDEITEMPLLLQSKILRVIQEKEVERLGGKKTIDLDVRIIATTNRDLKEEVQEKRFREDLYYRLNVFPIRCLSLKERPKDILPLASLFLNKYGIQDNQGPMTLSADAKAKLIGYAWPGNVRELDNLIQRVAVLSTNRSITANDIQFEGQFLSEGVMPGIQSKLEDASKLGNDMRHHEYQLIVESLAKCQGKKKEVAEQLGISARTLRYKIARMREMGYSIPDKKSFA